MTVVTTFAPQDNRDRRRIRDSLDETLFVEAGAGTGKTTSLVDRVTRLVSSGRTTLDRVAVITFTEAAASELSDRIRERLEDATSNPSLPAEERENCRQGLADLDRASIQTLHSFAGSILRERPLEAGLPPVFDTLDAIASDLHFEEAWTAWVDWALDAPELAESLSLAFSLGLSTSRLRDVALKFHDNYDLLGPASFGDVLRVAPSAAAAMVGQSDELRRLCGYSKLGQGDALYDHVQGLLRSLSRLGTLEPGSFTAYRLLQRIPIRQTNGRQPDWDRDPHTGENACKRLKELLAGLNATVVEELERVRQYALVPILRSLRRFALDYAVTRKSMGVAGFHDLLVWARDLLRDNIEVRDHFRQRFTHLLIDEAQDTDPIQAEIAMFLAEDATEPAPPGGRPVSWQGVTPQPGKLFVVGDPKQSIYRFRRADVGQMSRLRQRMGGETVRLVQNFRSQRPILACVNRIFDAWMAEGPGQPEYVPVAPRWEATTDHPAGPRAWALGGVLEGNMGAVRREEARRIAGLLQHMVANQWQVLDTEATEASGQEQYRPAKHSDICLLMPVRTGLRTLELALDDAGIPYRLEGASLIFGTQEVRDLINCLKAMDDPADQVATVAALRSPAFACTDVELWQFSEAGGKFDCLSDFETIEGPVAQALGSLHRFHKDRLWGSVAGLTDRFIRERRLLESAVDHPRTREQWRRYRFIVEQARAFAEAGGDSLRGFLDWVERQAAEGARVTETPVPEADEEAVRVMTVHAAKGLEFPIVLLTALNSNRRASREAVLFDRESQSVEVSVGSGTQRLHTPGYADQSEREEGLADEEYVRLLYVATTRARDHLVLSLYRGQRDRSSGAARIAGLLDTAGDLWEAAPEIYPVAPPAPGAPASGLETAGDFLVEREEWKRRREEALQAQGRPASVAATTLARIEKEERETEEEPWKRGRGGTSVGRALHAVLQTINLDTGDGIEETSRAQAAAEGIPQRWDALARLARRAVENPVVRRAVASARLWREVPAAVPLGDGAVEGFIDLLFEEDGELVVVDYKTDDVDPDETAEAVERYRLQAGAYALVAQRATGKTVKEVIFLFLRPDRAEILTDIPELVAKAEAAAISYLRGGATS